jgi:hypothetical protein
MVQQFWVASGDVASNPFIEPKLGEQSKPRSQALLAMETFFRKRSLTAIHQRFPIPTGELVYLCLRLIIHGYTSKETTRETEKVSDRQSLELRAKHQPAADLGGRRREKS